MLFVVVISVSVLLELAIPSESADLNYCKENLLPSKSTELIFSKEHSSKEYGIVNKPKSIHCCAQNFDTIQWFKNDEPYPWRSDVSNMRPDRSSRNQTLYVDKLDSKDAGTYKCVITSRDSFLSQEIPLEVFGEFQGEPQVTFTPAERLTVSARDPARFYCETFVGKIDLPDANNDIQWFKKDGPNNTALTADKNLNIHVQKITRDDGITLGMYLMINKVEEGDFGDYICSASNTGDQITERTSQLIRIDHSKSLIFIGLGIGIVVVIIMFVLLCYKYGYNFMLFIRPYVTRVKCDENSDIKDVFILFEIREADFVTQVLIPRLNHYQYSVEAHTLENGVFVGTECQSRITNCRTVLVVVSSPDPGSVQDCKCFSQKLYIASKLGDKVKVICPIVQEKMKINEAEIRTMVGSTPNLTYFAWPLYKKDWSRLWLSLRYSLGLPLKKSNESHINNNMITCPSSKRTPFSV